MESEFIGQVGDYSSELAAGEILVDNSFNV